MMRKVFFGIILLCLVISGCSRKTVVHKYYLLETTDRDAEVVRSSPLVEAVCELMPVTVHPAFAGTRIAVRMKSHELIYYARHQWATTPDESLLQLTKHELQNRNLFSHIYAGVVRGIPSYRIHVQVHRLEAIQNEDEDLSAHLVVTFSLIDHAQNRFLVSHDCDKSIPLEENNLNLFAATISDLYYSELQKFADKMESYFENATVPDTGSE